MVAFHRKPHVYFPKVIFRIYLEAAFRHQRRQPLKFKRRSWTKYFKFAITSGSDYDIKKPLQYSWNERQVRSIRRKLWDDIGALPSPPHILRTARSYSDKPTRVGVAAFLTPTVKRRCKRVFLPMLAIRTSPAESRSMAHCAQEHVEAAPK